MAEYAWLSHEQEFALVVNLGAYFSTVRYTKGGIEYEVIVENDEFYILEGEDD